GRASILRESLRQAKVAPATAGLRDTIDPGAFLRSMGLRGTEKTRLMNTDRFDALFSGSDQYKQLQDFMDGTRRLADSSYANRSGTNIREETGRWIEHATNLFQATLTGLRKAAGTGATMVGLKGMAGRMNPSSPSYLSGAPRYEFNPAARQRITTLPPIPAMIATEEMRQ
ncbi:unnamed protein product, partial [marine sediment metagenome]